VGSGAAASSIERVLDAHGKELYEETWESLPEVVKALKPRLELEGEIEEIERWLVFAVPRPSCPARAWTSLRARSSLSARTTAANTLSYGGRQGFTFLRRT
jgi:hypothetical protein